MTHYKFGSDIPHKEIPKKVDIAIVGAGMSGLYSAWRLKEEAEINDLAIFERSDRTGGRLDSDLIEFKNHKEGDNQSETITVKEEQGGMRFLFEDMDDLMSLFLMLNLQDQIVPFPMNSGGNNRLYHRGKSFTVAEAEKNDHAIWSSLYNLAPAERGVNPTDILDIVFNRILQANPQFNSRPKSRGPEFWQNFRLQCKWNGRSLNEWSLWDLFTDMGYTQEFITLVYRLLGFNGTFLSKMNAGAAYQLLEDFPANARFRTFKDGFSTLPNALVDRVGCDHIHLKTSIEELDYDENQQEYILTYVQTDDKGNETKGQIRANKVILGLPRLALEKLFVKSKVFHRLNPEQSSKLWNTLQSTSNQPLLKINLYYKNAWWANGVTGRPTIEFGPNFADLPTGSVYPFYAVNDELAASLMFNELENKPALTPEQQKNVNRINDEKYSRPAALTIYCDYMNINFWSSLQRVGTDYKHPEQHEYIKSVPNDMYPASTKVVEQATKFFKEIFDTHYVPEPILTSARIWEGSTRTDICDSQKFGYGVHLWAIGANDKQVIEDLVEPFNNLFTCGEAFSDYQGWVEGALRSADLVLKNAFGLPHLSEKYKDEDKNNKSPSDAIQLAYDDNATQLIQKYIDSGFSPESIDQNTAFVDKSSVIGVNLSYFDQK